MAYKKRPMAKRGRKLRKMFKKYVAKPSKSFVRKVKRIVDKQTETKVCVFQSNPTAFNQMISTSGDCLRLIPQVSPGTGQNQRIGAEIKAKSLHIRGVLTMTLGQTVAANTRFGVRMMILRAKRFADWQQTQADFATSYSRLLEGSVQGMNGDLANWNCPTNKEYFSVIKDKRFIFTIGQGSTTNEVFNAVKYYSFNIPYSKKILRYDNDYSTTDPVNYGYVMVLGYTKLDGSVPDLAATTYLTNQYTTTLKFEDA